MVIKTSVSKGDAEAMKKQLEAGGWRGGQWGSCPRKPAAVSISRVQCSSWCSVEAVWLSAPAAIAHQAVTSF